MNRPTNPNAPIPRIVTYLLLCAVILLSVGYWCQMQEMRMVRQAHDNLLNDIGVLRMQLRCKDGELYAAQWNLKRAQSRLEMIERGVLPAGTRAISAPRPFLPSR